MQLSIIILNWNSKDYLRACLRSVYAQTRDVEFEVVVIDGASYDGCGAMLAREFPQVRFIQSDQNVGFAKANNVAVSQSVGETLLFLNPDTEVQGNSIEQLHATVRSIPDAGAVGARLLNSDGTLQISCIQAFPTLTNQLLACDIAYRWLPRCRWWGKQALYAPCNVPAEVAGISGACLMTPRRVFDLVGGFSEYFFMYYEDVEYCLKVQRIGWKTVYVPTASVVHHGERSVASVGNDFLHIAMMKSAYRYFRVHWGPFTAQAYRALMSLNAVLRLLLLLPMCLLLGSHKRATNVRASVERWWAVMRWCLGLNVAADYDYPGHEDRAKHARLIS